MSDGSARRDSSAGRASDVFGRASVIAGLASSPIVCVAQCGPMDAIAANAAAKPDAPAIIEGERHLTWREYHARRNRLAHALAGRGLQSGEHVIVYAPNSTEYLLASA